MTTERLMIDHIPELLLGEESDRLWLFIHGRLGRKEEAEDFAPFAAKNGAQVLAIDLPGHGERGDESPELQPWTVVPELRRVMAYARERWPHISLRANSIGAWLAMQAFAGESPERSLFVSPILDMEALIGKMLLWAGVTEPELAARGRIPTAFGETLDIEYLRYVRANPICRWDSPTCILYAGGDNMTERSTVDGFVSRFGCTLTVMERGEHWFHTPEQLAVLNHWTAESL